MTKKRRPRRWKMWASYREGAKLPIVCTSRWMANYDAKWRSTLQGVVFPVEVREIVRKK